MNTQAQTKHDHISFFNLKSRLIPAQNDRKRFTVKGTTVFFYLKIYRINGMKYEAAYMRLD